jgi:hypothetical protein
MGEPGRPFESASLTRRSAFVLIALSVVGLPRLRRRASIAGPFGFSSPLAGSSLNTQTLNARAGFPPARAVCVAAV